ncbi:TetR/AcrR family transcriptional regulator [Thermoleophilia bacterium SCSIO 60948]|nr:TetR/AcrR family transcriptional regulator [Thermoleophilia bacterium SCSIO 60948]
MSSTSPSSSGEPALERRPRAPHLGPAKRRPLVLDAALRLIVERGYEATSMGAIAEASGVTKPVVYECFASKNELFSTLLEREERRIVTAVSEAMPRIDPATGDIEDVLRRGFTALLSGAREAPDSWRIVFDPKGGSDPLVEGRRRAVRAAATERLELEIRAVVDARNETSHPERLAAVLAEALISIAESGVRTLLASDGDWTPEELARLLARVSARGVESL